MVILDIGWAIRGLKLGKKVRRRGWRDKRKFLWFKPPVDIKAEWGKDPELAKLAEEAGETISGLGTICMYLQVDGKSMSLTDWWHPTPCDLLAEDWEEVAS